MYETNAARTYDNRGSVSERCSVEFIAISDAEAVADRVEQTGLTLKPLRMRLQFLDRFVVDAVVDLGNFEGTITKWGRLATSVWCAEK